MLSRSMPKVCKGCQGRVRKDGSCNGNICSTYRAPARGLHNKRSPAVVPKGTKMISARLAMLRLSSRESEPKWNIIDKLVDEFGPRHAYYVLASTFGLLEKWAAVMVENTTEAELVGAILLMGSRDAGMSSDESFFARLVKVSQSKLVKTTWQLYTAMR